MARITYLKCDRCGKQFEIGNQYKHTDEEGQQFTINSFRIGDWDQKGKKWRSIASGYDLCADCARGLADYIFAGEANPIKMHAVVRPDKKQEKPGNVVSQENTESLDGE